MRFYVRDSFEEVCLSCHDLLSMFEDEGLYKFGVIESHGNPRHKEATCRSSSFPSRWGKRHLGKFTCQSDPPAFHGAKFTNPPKEIASFAMIAGRRFHLFLLDLWLCVRQKLMEVCLVLFDIMTSELTQYPKFYCLLLYEAALRWSENCKKRNSFQSRNPNRESHDHLHNKLIKTHCVDKLLLLVLTHSLPPLIRPSFNPVPTATRTGEWTSGILRSFSFAMKEGETLGTIVWVGRVRMESHSAKKQIVSQSVY